MRHFSIRRLAIALALLITALTALCGAGLFAQPDTGAPVGFLTPLVYKMEIEGAIGAVSDNRIEDAINRAEDNSAELLIIVMDTPGGGLKSTWSICKRILNSRVPICVYIAPSGARAGSAGVFIAYAAHFAAMAPSTNIGAAHPVSGEGKIPDSVMNEKVTNDAVAQIKAAAERRGRNAAWAERAVRESVSITDREALDSNVVDIRAETVDDLLRQIDGRQTEVVHGKKSMHTVGARVETLERTFAQRLLETLLSPDIVFILFSIGGLGIVLELYNPGSIFPGVVGAISLILAFYASQTLPINYAGVLLILLAIILFIVEIKVISHGLLTVGGIISLILGGLLLFDSVDPTMRVSVGILITMAVLIGATLLVTMFLVYKAQRHRPFIGDNALIGKKAELRADHYVYLDGALWKVAADELIEAGTMVEVVGMENLVLKVRKVRT